jgi:cytochrome P450
VDEILLPLIHARTKSRDDNPPCYAESLLGLRVPGEGDRPLTDGEVVSMCLEFLSTGNDGTATLLEWIMAELVNRPKMQARVYEEVRSKPELSEEDLQAMPSLKAVVLEGLRLHCIHRSTSSSHTACTATPRGSEATRCPRARK